MYKKKGFPKKNELVVCKGVEKLLAHTVFMELEEYDSREGMLHASELHRKWLRNWKSMLKPGTKTVCMVIRVNEVAGHIDLSVRRVGSAQHRNKLKEWADEKRADGILGFYAKQSKIKDIYKEIGDKLLEHYDGLYPVFLEVAKGDEKLIEQANIPKDKADKFIAFIKQRITIPLAEVPGKLNISSISGTGVEHIKEVLTKAKELAKKKKVEFKVNYIGAPEFKYKIIAKDYKIAGAVHKEIVDFVTKFMNKHEGKAEFKK